MTKRLLRRTMPILTEGALEQAVEYHCGQDHVSFDVETKGPFPLDPRRNQVFWASLSSRGRTDVIPFGHPIGKVIGETKEPRTGPSGTTRMYRVPVYDDPPEQLLPSVVFDGLEPLLFADTGRRLWGHNLKFDLESTAKYYGGEHPTGPYGDTMVAAFLLNENFYDYRLGTVVAREFRYSYDKSIGEAVHKYPFYVASNYSYLDALYTYLLGDLYYPMIKEAGLSNLFDLEMDLLGALCRMEENGSPLVDIDALRELDADLDVQLEEIKGRLYRAAGSTWNFNSNPQKIHLFYDKKKDGGQGLRPKKFTPTGQPSTDAESLELHRGNMLVDAFLDYQEINKLSSTYVKAYLGTKVKKATDKNKNNAPPYNGETGRIHTNFKQTGAVTGRLSSSAPNIQNIPRPDDDRGLGQRIRGLFMAEEGHSLIVADWSQVEYRILAYYSKDKRLIKAFDDGLDFHQFVASLLLGKPFDDITKVERTVSKNTNFAVAYGAGIEKIAAMSKVTYQQAEDFSYAHREMLPGMYKFCAEVVRVCRTRRPAYVRTILGRRRRLKDINSNDFKKRKAAERQAVNSVIQGSAADLMKFAIVRADILLPPAMPMNFTVHDELVVTARDDMVEDCVAIIREAMMGREIASLIAPVPLVADIKVVKRWSDAKG